MVSKNTDKGQNDEFFGCTDAAPAPEMLEAMEKLQADIKTHQHEPIARADLIPEPGATGSAENAWNRRACETDVKFRDLLKTHKLSVDEYGELRKILGRVPTFAELGVFSAMWSEHCSYKSSRVHLSRLPTEGEQVVQGPGENAGVVRIEGKLCIAFKMESHNHPSYIEPYQGAATGVGGIMRDVFCMGARPIANLNSLRFGRKNHQKTPWLVENVVKGIGDYGNCVGIPTVAGTVSFDPSYDGNCLVNAMTLGTIHEDRIFKGEATGAGNLLVYLGSATGRDGIHGATMASDSFASEPQGERSAVQVGDPFTEKMLLEATLEVLERNLVVGLQDMGAAGLTSSSFEMADRAGMGLWMNLDAVPTRTSGMTAYELLLSESQERMLMVITPDKWSELARVLAKWELSYGIIGVVTDTGRVQATHKGRLEVDVPVAEASGSAPKYDRPTAPRPEQKSSAPTTAGLEDDCFEAMTQPEFFGQVLAASGQKTPVFQQYDHHIGIQTVLGPQEGGAAALWVRSEWANEGVKKEKPYLGVLTTCASNERYNRCDAHYGGAHAVVKCARTIAAAGGKGLAVTDCLNYGNPEKPEVMGDFARGVDGIGEACKELNTPVVSGNVSLYNETDDNAVAPTPMIGMVGKMDDVRRAAPAVLSEKTLEKKGSSQIEWRLLAPKNLQASFAGSLARTITLQTNTAIVGEPEKRPALDWALERKALETVANIVTGDAIHRHVLACRDIGSGGLFAAIAKMLLDGQQDGQYETQIQLPEVLARSIPVSGLPSLAQLAALGFAELDTAWVLAVDPAIDAQKELVELLPDELQFVKIGSSEVSKGGQFHASLLDAHQSWDMASLAASYSGGLPL